MLSISKIISSTIFAIVQIIFLFLSPSRRADTHARVEQRTCCNNFFDAACEIAAPIVRLAPQSRSRAFRKTFSSSVVLVRTYFRLVLSSTDVAGLGKTSV
jgi:hypothetical protein